MKKKIVGASLLAVFHLAPFAVSAEEDKSETPASTSEPFAFGDFTWLNGNSRQKTSVLDTKYFTPTFIADTNYIYDFNNPKDHTLVGSTSAGRTSELQIQQLGVGGDFHYEHARGRLMTQFGMYSTMTPRNDASTSRGQWNSGDAYKYISEAYGGYHWDKMHGINLDAGIFMSYIGLFSYYNVENWAYQASYTSANTPWFFNGLRLQAFPTDRLKLELWLINGWQSYGMYNEDPGVGFQVLYRPNENLSWVFNGYTGYDTLNSNRQRYHSDNSVQYKYLDHPTAGLSKAAFSITGDFGCESGDGVRCTGGDSQTPSQYFIGLMAYNRVWFDKDTYAVTVGGGFINNPGRYLVLYPPIQTGSGATGGASATGATQSAAFTMNPGDDFRAWDATLTFDYMPDQFVTFRSEFSHREANVNYFAGPGGITSKDGLNTTPTTGFTPDLVKSENRLNFAMMVRF